MGAAMNTSPTSAAVQRPPLSVLIITLRDWPECELALRSVYDQALAVGAEVVVADGGGAGLPADAGAWPAVRWLKLPGATMYQALAHGLMEARGEIIAMTEDHCRVPPGWCAAVLQAHREAPQADLIGGSVVNGAPGLLDWASFLVTSGAYLPPVPPGPSRALCGRGNLSLKRRALPAEIPPEGVADYTLKEALLQGGAQLWIDPRLSVTHVQVLGISRAFWYHMVAGRDSTAFLHTRTPLAERRRDARRRLLTLPYIPLRDGYRVVVQILRSKPKYRAVTLAAAPVIVALRAAHVMGEILALRYGPGSQVWQLR
jgi:hypothetical protein